MNFWIEWVLAMHRAVWFPLNWTLGLERPGIELPIEFAPAIAGQIALTASMPSVRRRPSERKAAASPNCRRTGRRHDLKHG